MITAVFFDLDNTLYPQSSGLMKALDREIIRFCAAYLKVSEEKAQKMRSKRPERYATTLEWLMADHSFSDIEDYMDAIHPRNVGLYLPKNPALRPLLQSLGRQLHVLTNSPLEHARRVLEHLEIIDCFTHIFDLKTNQYIGKPDPEIVGRNLATAGVKANESLLVDDLPQNVHGFMQMGGYALLIDEKNSYKGPAPALQSVMQISAAKIDQLQKDSPQ